jgi:hypothetical protein
MGPLPSPCLHIRLGESNRARLPSPGVLQAFGPLDAPVESRLLRRGRQPQLAGQPAKRCQHVRRPYVRLYPLRQRELGPGLARRDPAGEDGRRFLACDGSSDHRGRPILHRHLGAWQLTFALCFALCHKLACSPSSLLAASGASAAASQQLPAAAALRSCCWPSPKFPPCSWSEPEMGDRRLKLRPPKLLCAAAHAVSDSGLALEIQLSHAADLEPARARQCVDGRGGGAAAAAARAAARRAVMQQLAPSS